MTAGDIFKRIAAKAGTTAIVDPELAKIKLPYRLRWKQQAGDFAEELAQELGGTLKLAGGHMAVLKRGSGRSASGAALAPIIVPFSEDYGFSITVEQRGLYAEADGGWFDTNAGIEQMATGKGLGRPRW